MSQITLRNLPKPVEAKLRELARKKHTSLNRAVTEILEKALIPQKKPQKKRDVSGIAGMWSQAENKEFEKNCSFFDTIDPDIWQ